MAKGLRASVKKSNRTKLRARVFEPVENARLERLHQKLLATAQQPKPDDPKKNQMELDAQGAPPASATPSYTPSDPPNPDAPAPEASNEDELSKGWSFLSARIPDSLHADPSACTPPSDAATNDTECSDFYHLLGLCTDVVGFTRNGALEFAFDPHTP